mmetsp:Transcript_11109/g.20966  ORF Transcript_11109/g.20966 Transcript_11109/m.20966 type:complete len:134 (+) Transcript_11109:69-470(+)
MGCANSAGVHQHEVKIQHDDAESVASVSTKAESNAVTTRTSTSKTSTSLSALSMDVLDLDSSWEFEKCPIAVPDGMVVRRPPTRKLHEKHVKHLNKFLRSVEKDPDKLKEQVKQRRLPVINGNLGEENVILSF